MKVTLGSNRNDITDVVRACGKVLDDLYFENAGVDVVGLVAQLWREALKCLIVNREGVTLLDDKVSLLNAVTRLEGLRNDGCEVREGNVRRWNVGLDGMNTLNVVSDCSY